MKEGWRGASIARLRLAAGRRERNSWGYPTLASSAGRIETLFDGGRPFLPSTCHGDDAQGFVVPDRARELQHVFRREGHRRMVVARRELNSVQHGLGARPAYRREQRQRRLEIGALRVRHSRPRGDFLELSGEQLDAARELARMNIDAWHWNRTNPPVQRRNVARQGPFHRGRL